MKRIDSIEQALQQAQKLQFVMVTELSRVVIGKMPMDINWDELLEARFSIMIPRSAFSGRTAH